MPETVNVIQLVLYNDDDTVYNKTQTKATRQSEMANTSPRHMPVLGNVYPIKIKNIFVRDIDIISLFLYF